MTSGAAMCHGDGFPREDWASGCSEPKNGETHPFHRVWVPSGVSPATTLPLPHAWGAPRGSTALRCWGWVEEDAHPTLEGCDGRWGTWGADLSLSDQVSLLSSFSLTAAAQPGKHPAPLLLPLRSGTGGAGGV